MLQNPGPFNPILIFRSMERPVPVPGSGRDFDEMQISSVNRNTKPKMPSGGRAFNHRSGGIDIKIPRFDHKSEKAVHTLL